MSLQYFSTKVVIVAALLALLGAASCSKRDTGAAKDSNIDYWTCTMHPSVHAAKPGKCPICSMDLVPVMKRSTGEAQSSPKPEGMKENKADGGAKSMNDMPGMPGIKEGTQTNAPQTSEFVVPVERQQQIGVTYAKVERKPLRHTIRAVGMVVPDKGRNWQF